MFDLDQIAPGWLFANDSVSRAKRLGFAGAPQQNKARKNKARLFDDYSLKSVRKDMHEMLVSAATPHETWIAARFVWDKFCAEMRTVADNAAASAPGNYEADTLVLEARKIDAERPQFAPEADQRQQATSQAFSLTGLRAALRVARLLLESATPQTRDAALGILEDLVDEAVGVTDEPQRMLQKAACQADGLLLEAIDWLASLVESDSPLAARALALAVALADNFGSIMSHVAVFHLLRAPKSAALKPVWRGDLVRSIPDAADASDITPKTVSTALLGKMVAVLRNADRHQHAVRFFPVRFLIESLEAAIATAATIDEHEQSDSLVGPLLRLSELYLDGAWPKLADRVRPLLARLIERAIDEIKPLGLALQAVFASINSADIFPPTSGIPAGVGRALVTAAQSAAEAPERAQMAVKVVVSNPRLAISAIRLAHESLVEAAYGAMRTRVIDAIRTRQWNAVESDTFHKEHFNISVAHALRAETHPDAVKEDIQRHVRDAIEVLELAEQAGDDKDKACTIARAFAKAVCEPGAMTMVKLAGASDMMLETWVPLLKQATIQSVVAPTNFYGALSWFLSDAFISELVGAPLTSEEQEFASAIATSKILRGGINESPLLTSNLAESNFLEQLACLHAVSIDERGVCTVKPGFHPADDSSPASQLFRHLNRVASKESQRLASADVEDIWFELTERAVLACVLKFSYLTHDAIAFQQTLPNTPSLCVLRPTVALDAVLLTLQCRSTSDVQPPVPLAQASAQARSAKRALVQERSKLKVTLWMDGVAEPTRWVGVVPSSVEAFVSAIRVTLSGVCSREKHEHVFDDSKPLALFHLPNGAPIERIEDVADGSNVYVGAAGADQVPAEALERLRSVVYDQTLVQRAFVRAAFLLTSVAPPWTMRKPKAAEPAKPAPAPPLQSAGRRWRSARELIKAKAAPVPWRKPAMLVGAVSQWKSFKRLLDPTSQSSGRTSNQTPSDQVMQFVLKGDELSLPRLRAALLQQQQRAIAKLRTLERWMAPFAESAHLIALTTAFRERALAAPHGGQHSSDAKDALVSDPFYGGIQACGAALSKSMRDKVVALAGALGGVLKRTVANDQGSDAVNPEHLICHFGLLLLPHKPDVIAGVLLQGKLLEAIDERFTRAPPMNVSSIVMCALSSLTMQLVEGSQADPLGVDPFGVIEALVRTFLGVSSKIKENTNVQQQAFEHTLLGVLLAIRRAGIAASHLMDTVPALFEVMQHGSTVLQNLALRLACLLLVDVNVEQVSEILAKYVQPSLGGTAKDLIDFVALSLPEGTSSQQGKNVGEQYGLVVGMVVLVQSILHSPTWAPLVSAVVDEMERVSQAIARSEPISRRGVAALMIAGGMIEIPRPGEDVTLIPTVTQPPMRATVTRFNFRAGTVVAVEHVSRVMHTGHYSLVPRDRAYVEALSPAVDALAAIVKLMVPKYATRETVKTIAFEKEEGSALSMALKALLAHADRPAAMAALVRGGMIATLVDLLCPLVGDVCDQGYLRFNKRSEIGYAQLDRTEAAVLLQRLSLGSESPSNPAWSEILDTPATPLQRTGDLTHFANAALKCGLQAHPSGDAAALVLMLCATVPALAEAAKLPAATAPTETAKPPAVTPATPASPSMPTEGAAAQSPAAPPVGFGFGTFGEAAAVPNVTFAPPTFSFGSPNTSGLFSGPPPTPSAPLAPVQFGAAAANATAAQPAAGFSFGGAATGQNLFEIGSGRGSAGSSASKSPGAAKTFSFSVNPGIGTDRSATEARRYFTSLFSNTFEAKELAKQELTLQYTSVWHPPYFPQLPEGSLVSSASTSMGWYLGAAFGEMTLSFRYAHLLLLAMLQSAPHDQTIAIEHFGGAERLSGIVPAIFSAVTLAEMHEDADLRSTVAPTSLGTASLATLTLLKLLKSRVLSPRALASQTGAVWSKLWECAIALIVQTESVSRVCSGLWLARALLNAADELGDAAPFNPYRVELFYAILYGQSSYPAFPRTFTVLFQLLKGITKFAPTCYLREDVEAVLQLPLITDLIHKQATNGIAPYRHEFLAQVGAAIAAHESASAAEAAKPPSDRRRLVIVPQLHIKQLAPNAVAALTVLRAAAEGGDYAAMLKQHNMQTHGNFLQWRPSEFLEKRFIMMAMTTGDLLTGSGYVSLAQAGSSNPFTFHLAPPLGHASRPYVVTMNAVFDSRALSCPDLDLVVLACKSPPTTQEQADSMRAIVQSAEAPVQSADGISVLAVRPFGSDTNLQLDDLTLPAGSVFILIYLRTTLSNMPVTVKRFALWPVNVGDGDGKEGAKRTWTRAMDEALLAALYPVMMDTVKSFTDCAAAISNDPLLSAVTMDEAAARYILLTGMSTAYKTAADLFDLFNGHMPHTAAYYVSRCHSLIPFLDRNAQIRRRLESSNSNTGSTTGRNVSGPAIRLNRMKALAQGKVTDPAGISQSRCMFMQLFTQVKQNVRIGLMRDSARIWQATFEAEGSMDYGGPYRESISLAVADLAEQNIPLFAPTPNCLAGVGTDRDKLIPNPALSVMSDSLEEDLFYFVGILMGLAIRSRLPLQLQLPSLVWKQLVYEPLTMADLERIDQPTATCLQFVANIERQGIDAENFSLAFDENFTIQPYGRDERVELVPGGEAKPVTFANRKEWCDLVLHFRLNEYSDAVRAMRRGLLVVIPRDLLTAYDSITLEKGVCGSKGLDVALLREHTRYVRCHSRDPVVLRLWEALEQLTEDEQGRFLSFVWGRTTLPSASDMRAVLQQQNIEGFEVRLMGSPTSLPMSHTCFFQLDLPPYESTEQMLEKLRYAIHHCKAIDADFNPHQGFVVSDDEGDR